MLVREGLRSLADLAQSPAPASATSSTATIRIQRASEADRDHLRTVLDLIEEAKSWLVHKGEDQWANPYSSSGRRDHRAVRNLASASRNARQAWMAFDEMAHDDSRPVQNINFYIGYVPTSAASTRRKRRKRRSLAALTHGTVAQQFISHPLSVAVNELYARLMARLWQSVMVAANVIISIVISALAQAGIIAASTIAIISTIMSKRHRHEPADESLVIPSFYIWSRRVDVGR